MTPQGHQAASKPKGHQVWPTLRPRLHRHQTRMRAQQHQARQSTDAIMSENMQARVLQEIRNVQQPTRLRVSHWKDRALDQLITTRIQLKTIQQPEPSNQVPITKKKQTQEVEQRPKFFSSTVIMEHIDENMPRDCMTSNHERKH